MALFGVSGNIGGDTVCGRCRWLDPSEPFYVEVQVWEGGRMSDDVWKWLTPARWGRPVVTCMPYLSPATGVVEVFV